MLHLFYLPQDTEKSKTESNAVKSSADEAQAQMWVLWIQNLIFINRIDHIADADEDSTDVNLPCRC